jgi:hypothetical protein
MGRTSNGSDPVQSVLNLAYDLVEGRRILVDARRLYFLIRALVQGILNVFGTSLALFRLSSLEVLVRSS